LLLAAAVVAEVAAAVAVVAPVDIEPEQDSKFHQVLQLLLLLVQEVLVQHLHILPEATTETILFFQLLRQPVVVMDRLLMLEQVTEVQAVMVDPVAVALKEMLLQQVV
jgi:hypothetical protein